MVRRLFDYGSTLRKCKALGSPSSRRDYDWGPSRHRFYWHDAEVLDRREDKSDSPLVQGIQQLVSWRIHEMDGHGGERGFYSKCFLLGAASGQHDRHIVCNSGVDDLVQALVRDEPRRAEQEACR